MTDNFETWLAQLQAAEVAQRSQAVLQLQPGTRRDDEAIAALVAVLCEDADLNVIEDATWVLVKYGTAATAALLAVADQADARARHNIVHALGKIGDAQAVPALIQATQDTDATVRLKAVYSLGQIGDARAIEALIMRLDDAEQNVSWTAREVLEGFGDQALPALIAALKLESAEVRELVANLLGEIGDATAVEPLMAALATENWQLRFAIVEALGAIGDARALPALEKLADDPQGPVRAMAKNAAKMIQP